MCITWSVRRVQRAHAHTTNALKKEIVTLPSVFSIGTGTEVSGDKRLTPASPEILDPPRARLVSSTNAWFVRTRSSRPEKQPSGPRLIQPGQKSTSRDGILVATALLKLHLRPWRRKRGSKLQVEFARIVTIAITTRSISPLDLDRKTKRHDSYPFNYNTQNFAETAI